MYKAGFVLLMLHNEQFLEIRENYWDNSLRCNKQVHECMYVPHSFNLIAL